MWIDQLLFIITPWIIGAAAYGLTRFFFKLNKFYPAGAALIAIGGTVWVSPSLDLAEIVLLGIVLLGLSLISVYCLVKTVPGRGTLRYILALIAFFPVPCLGLMQPPFKFSVPSQVVSEEAMPGLLMYETNWEEFYFFSCVVLACCTASFMVWAVFYYKGLLPLDDRHLTLQAQAEKELAAMDGSTRWEDYQTHDR